MAKQAKRLVLVCDAVIHSLLEGDLAQDHTLTLAPLERSPHRERDGADRNAMTVKGTDS